MKVPTSPNIHLIRGNVVHETLEYFFDLDSNKLSNEGFKQQLTLRLKDLFEKQWNAKKKHLSKLRLSQEKLMFYHDESKLMLANWLNSFFNKVDEELKHISVEQAFNKLKPLAREIKYQSEVHQVRGFVDVIEDNDGEIKLVDYKTSKPKDYLTKEYKLQLAIYSLMYKEKHGKLPDKVSVWFLKNKEVVVDVTEEMVKNAAFEIEQIHFATESDMIKDYKKVITPLCKYSTGQCDFYDICMRQR